MKTSETNAKEAWKVLCSGRLSVVWYCAGARTYPVGEWIHRDNKFPPLTAFRDRADADSFLSDLNKEFQDIEKGLLMVPCLVLEASDGPSYKYSDPRDEQQLLNWRSDLNHRPGAEISFGWPRGTVFCRAIKCLE